MRKLIVFISLVAITFTACKKEVENNKAEKSIPVKIANVENKKISIPIHSTGKLSSQTESKLAFKTGGIVRKIFVEEGQSVSKGEVLAKLDLVEIQAKVNQAKAGYAKAERDLKRVEALYKDSVVTLEQLQNVNTAYNVAKSNLEIANFNLTHSQIVAPTNGKILKRFAEENELVAPGTPIFIFGSSGNSWIMKISVTDKDISKIKYGDKAKVTIDVFPEKPFDAKVTEIASAANPYNGTYEVELTITTKSKRIISGMIATAEIFPDGIMESKVIPISALVNADGKSGSVFIPTKNNTIAKRINIKIIGIVGDDVIVNKGLSNIKEVITDGVEYLTDGERIKVIK